jgi:hypothetical protein
MSHSGKVDHSGHGEFPRTCLLQGDSLKTAHDASSF